MHWYHTAYFISIMVTVAVMGYIAWYSRRHRDSTPGAGVYMWVSLMVCLLAFFEGMSIISPTREWALFWFNARILSFASIPVLWFMFVLQYTGKPRLLSGPRVAALFVIPVVTQVMIWTNSLHGLWVVRDVGFHRAGPFYIAETAVRIAGPWYKVHLLYTYVLMMAGVTVLFINVSRMFRQSRGQALALGIGTLIMIMGSLFPTFNLIPGMEISPMIPIFSLGSLIIALGVYRYRLFETEPLVDEGKRIPRKLIMLLVIMSAGILVAGYLYYRHYEQRFREGVERELYSIVSLKVDELVRWRTERLGDANLLYHNDVMTSLVDRFFANTSDANVRWRLQTWLGKFRSAYRYDHILLLDARGAARLSFPHGTGDVCEYVLQNLDAIRRSGAVTFLDFHREAPDKPINLSLVVPVMYDGDTAGVLGFIVLVVDPDEYLYAMISRWPMPSRTAETLIVRKEGDDVLFLNELRFKKNSALKLRIPLTQHTVPAVMAAIGRDAVTEGFDYRGVPVVAATRAVPGSPWFMVARMDMTEVYAPVRERLWIMIVLMAALLSGAGAGIGLFWRQQSDRFYRDRYEAAEAMNALSAHQEALLSAIPDIIVEVDNNKIYSWANGPGIEFFGDDVIGREAAFYFEGEQDTYNRVQPFFYGDDAIIYIESWQRRRDGEKRLLAWWCRGLKDEKGNVTGALSTARDITDQKRGEAELLLKNIVFETSIAANSIADTDGIIRYANGSFLRLWGNESTDDVLGRPVSSFFADEGDATPVINTLNEKGAWEGEFVARRKDGSTFIVQAFATVIRDEKGELRGYQSSNIDITEQRKTENMIKQYTIELERSNLDLQQFAYVASHDLQEPLRMISSYLQLIEKRYKDKLDADANDFINFAVDGAKRLQSLISGLLDFSRVMTHGKPFDSVNVKEVLAEVNRDLEIQIRETGATVSHADMPLIAADRAQIHRLFQNMIQNAIKFRREGTAPLITITAEKSNGEHVFCVRDNGIGIEEQYFGPHIHHLPETPWPE